jgi:hypothetical protein
LHAGKVVALLLKRFDGVINGFLRFEAKGVHRLAHGAVECLLADFFKNKKAENE